MRPYIFFLGKVFWILLGVFVRLVCSCMVLAWLVLGFVCFGVLSFFGIVYR